MIGQNIQNGGASFAPYVDPSYGFNQQVRPTYQMPETQQNYTPKPQQIQYSNTIVPVANESVGRNFPVGPGVGVIFRDENAPYMYSKTMGFNPLEQPVFKKYRLVEEEADEVNPESAKTVNYEAEIEELRDQISELRNLINKYSSKSTTKKTNEGGTDK